MISLQQVRKVGCYIDIDYLKKKKENVTFKNLETLSLEKFRIR